MVSVGWAIVVGVAWSRSMGKVFVGGHDESLVIVYASDLQSMPNTPTLAKALISVPANGVT